MPIHAAITNLTDMNIMSAPMVMELMPDVLTLLKNMEATSASGTVRRPAMTTSQGSTHSIIATMTTWVSIITN